MEKISLNTSPSSILSATIGTVFELDELDFVLEGDRLIYLTVVDSESEDWFTTEDGEVPYTVWAHVRNKAGYALMTREEMCSILESGNYFIE